MGHRWDSLAHRSNENSSEFKQTKRNETNEQKIFFIFNFEKGSSAQQINVFYVYDLRCACTRARLDVGVCMICDDGFEMDSLFCVCILYVVWDDICCFVRTPSV